MTTQRIEAKDEVLTLRLSAGDLSAAKTAAAFAGMSLSDFVRRALVGAVASKQPAAHCDLCGYAIEGDDYRTIVDHVRNWNGVRSIQRVRYAHDRCLT